MVYALIAVFLIMEWMGREQQYAIAKLEVRWPRFARVAIYYGLALAIFLFAGKGQDFIYFQF